MKVEAKKAIDAAQAVGTGAAAAMGGALGVDGASAFSTLLNSFTANDAKQAAAKPANINSSKETTPATSAAALNTKANAAKDTAPKYDLAAAMTESAAATDPKAQQKTQEPVKAQQPVKMEDLIKTLNLNEQQVKQLAQALNIGVNELKQMQVAVKTDAQTGAPLLTGIMANGNEQNLGSMLGMGAADGKTVPAQQVMDKIAGILNLDNSQKQDFFAQLNISSISFNDTKTANGDNGSTVLKNASAAKQADQTQPATTNSPSVTDMGKIAVQDAAQSANGAKQADQTQPATTNAPSGTDMGKVAVQDAAQSGNGANGTNSGNNIKNINTAKQTNQTQPTTKTSPLTIDMGKTAVQDAAQSKNDSNGGNSFNGEAGIQTAAVEQKNDSVAEQAPQTDFSAALSKAGETAAALGTKPVAANAAAQTQAAATARPDAKVMNQIVEKASILQFPNSTQTTISLNPKDLGNVDIKLTMHDASVTASITVENHDVKQAVEQNLGQLKSALHQQGITVDEMLVSVDQRNSGNPQNPNHSQRDAAANYPYTPAAPRAAEPAAVIAPAMLRPQGDHRVSITA